MPIEYDTPIEVSQRAYGILMSRFGTIVAGRIEGQRFFIKVWFLKHADKIQKIIDDN